MRICFFGDFDRYYSRNKIIIKMLVSKKHKVILCNYKSEPISFGLKSIFNNIKSQIQLIVLHSKIKYDVLIVGYPIIKSIWLAKLLSRKIIFSDPFISQYNYYINDYAIFKNKILKKMFLIFDKISFNLADYILSDTKTHEKFFSKCLGVSSDKFIVTYLGADTSIYYPKKEISHENFIVGFYGSYIPLQGVDIIVKAAEILKNQENIRFELIGGNKDNKLFIDQCKYANNKGLDNINFIERIPEESLPKYIQRSDIQLGIFGNTIKTKLVIPNKVYSAIAMKKPIITANTPAICECFTNGKDCIFSRIGDPIDLANKILELYNNNILRKEISINGYILYLKRFHPNEIGNELLKKLNEIKNQMSF